MPATENPLASDLDLIMVQATRAFEQLRNKRIFLTGGTGFFGSWLLESFVWANRYLDLNARATVLTRDEAKFCQKAPHLCQAEELQFLAGDIREFAYPAGKFDYIIHAATESGTALNEKDPALMLDAIVQGTKRVLDFAAQSECQHFLLTSSGAVYGPQPQDLTHIPETYQGAPNTLLPSSAYAEGKRVAELLTAIAARNYGIKCKVARCFSFVGPYLPIDVHFAIGNFIRDGLSGSSLQINGDGTPLRSYMYAADLMIWLWTILSDGEALKFYNVGSEDSLSIRETAEALSAHFSPAPKIDIARAADPLTPVSRYVPSTQRIQQELGLTQQVTLSESIAKTIAWHQARG